MQKIFLTGFMGSGKSTLGKQLANRLGFRFVDMDTAIEQAEGQAITAIFTEKGAAYFRRIEHRHLQHLIELQDNVVIATGGGAPCYFNNMEQMQRHGITIYLEMPPRALVHRLRQGQEQRPLIAGKSEEELLQFIAQKLKEREPWYLRSHIIVKGPDATAELLEHEIRMRNKTNEE